jgi:hypothetical protein
MKPLSEKFTRFGQQFEQICRTPAVAIYRRQLNGRQKSYEVIVIRVADRRLENRDGKAVFLPCEPYECYPSTEQWGSCGWTYTTEDDARAKYDLLNDPGYQLPAPPLYPIRVRARDGIAKERVSGGGSIEVAPAPNPVCGRAASAANPPRTP